VLARRRRCNRWRFRNSMIDPENPSYILIPGAGGQAHRPLLFRDAECGGARFSA
jgi:hypothetical protein